MKGMIFKKAVLLGGIFLLATFMLVQLSWGCDDDDKWERDWDDKWRCDHHDKWDCHKHDKPCHPPKIQSVDVVDVDLENKKIVIHGKNFDKGADPVVTLGGTKIEGNLTSPTKIEAIFHPSDFPNSDYRLVVSTCHNSARNDKYCKDHGPNCKCKYCKEHCSKCKDKYCKDYEYRCRCKDRYSLTIPGPSGPPSAITLTRESWSKQLPACWECSTVIDEKAVCPSGSVVTGGGFSCLKCEPAFLSISVNAPFQDSMQDSNGWYVVGNYFGTGKAAELTIYAICAQ